jgi:hypothetical protein
MSAVQGYSMTGALANSEERQTALAGSVVSLFKSTLTPTPATLKAAFEAAECDFDTYVAKTISAWLGPVLAPGTGYQIVSPLLLWALAGTDPTTPNTVGGWWLEDGAGVVRMFGTFDPFLPMEIAYQSVPLFLYDLFPTGFTG